VRRKRIERLIKEKQESIKENWRREEDRQNEKRT
jgi:hypothetical protein